MLLQQIDKTAKEMSVFKERSWGSEGGGEECSLGEYRDTQHSQKASMGPMGRLQYVNIPEKLSDRGQCICFLMMENSL